MVNYKVTTKRIESQRRFVLPMIEKKVKEIRQRPTTLYINLVTVFSGSSLAKSLTPQSKEEAYLLRDIVVNDLVDQGHKVRVNGTHVIELTLEK